MKRYLYTLFVALLFVVGCDIENFNKPDVAFCFGPVTTQTTDCSAKVEVLAYMTLDGEVYDGANIYLEYWKSGEDSNSTTVVTESVEGDTPFIHIFDINNLEPGMNYLVRVVIDGGKAYGSQKEIFTFVTKAQDNIRCDAKVDAKGFKATISLSNVAYLVGGESQEIAFLKLEYTLAGTDAWSAVEVSGSNIKGGKVNITIPKSGDSPLVENSDYIFRVTLTPNDGNKKPLTTDNFEFKTTYAEITANIAKPQMSYSGDGITIKVGNIEVYYDGVASNNYVASLYFHASGSSVWEEYALNEKNSVVIPASALDEGVTYESKVVIVAGAQRQVRESDVATLTTPQSEVPVVPVPPTGGDTSSIAGVWHLTSWRDATPSFEVYMDITATGGITLYQCLESRYWDVYQSTAAIEGGVIYGVYTDNVAWGASYNLSVDGDTMTWVSTADSSDVSVYTRSALPSSMPTAPTRAIVASERFL